MEVDKKIPVKFEVVEDFDSRFQKVKIWLMHLGLNYNNSVFNREAVVEAMETLKNTPILGYIEENKLGDKDFRGHEMELIVENGELKTRYLGQAYGVIPENCNPRFEEKAGDTGEMLTYLVVDGLLWTKFDEAVSILTDSDGVVNQSMELHDEYDGYWDEDGHFNFTKFSFYGATMLGEDVLPAMQKASVEQVFSMNVVQEKISKKLDEFNKLFSKNHFKEVEHEMTLEELLAKYNISEQDLQDKEIDVKEYSIEDLEAKIKDLFDSDEEAEEGSEDEGEGEGENPTDEEPSTEMEEKEDEEKEDVDEKFTLTFELSHEDIRRQMWEKIDSHMVSQGYEGDWYYIVSVFDNHIVIENDMATKFFKVDYNKEDDVINFNNVIEVHPMFLTAEEKGALELMRSNYEKMEQENEELKNFQTKVLKEQHEVEAENLFSQFSKLSEDDVADLREDIHNYSIEEVEAKLYEKLGRKMATFNKKEPKESARLKVDITDNETKPVGGYANVFSKYGLNPKK